MNTKSLLRKQSSNFTILLLYIKYETTGYRRTDLRQKLLKSWKYSSKYHHNGSCSQLLFKFINQTRLHLLPLFYILCKIKQISLNALAKPMFKFASILRHTVWFMYYSWILFYERSLGVTTKGQLVQVRPYQYDTWHVTCTSSCIQNMIAFQSVFFVFLFHVCLPVYSCFCKAVVKPVK